MKYTVKVLVLICTFAFISCDSDSTTNTDENSMFNFKAAEPPETTITIRVEGDFKRGKKWSEKHGVPPCTKGFGLCNIKVKFGEEGKSNANLKKSLNTNVMTIEFTEDQGIKDGDIFISSEDDFFELPSDVTKEFGETNMTIIPKDYLTKIDSEHPYGYVEVELVKN